MPTPGYHNALLRIDLTTRSAEQVELKEHVLRAFIGGSGLGTWILLQELARAARQRASRKDAPAAAARPARDRSEFDPLAPEAPLVFAFSPLVGSPLTTSAKFAVLAQSPLTYRINDSLSSSHFAIAGKKTGHDAFVVIGRCDEWTCLVIEPDGVRFATVPELEGTSAADAQAAILPILGPGFRIAAIGPAGERQVRFATISHDGRHAGRGGLGAVMGSKRLKAIAVRGDRLTSYAHPAEVVQYSKELSRRSFGPATAKYRELGTVGNLLTFNRLGTLPTRNFQQGEFAEAAALAPETLASTHRSMRASCAACTIGCEHLFELPQRGARVRMEYENLFALGPLCAISDPDAVLEASRRCDAWGIDTISTGGTIAFAMECAERGLIDWPELRFGNASAMLDAIDAIGQKRPGWGELLSLGSRAAAEWIGQGSDEFAPHVKGLEIPGYEPRALQTMALGFAVGTRGADHNRSGAYQVDFSESGDRFNPGPDEVAAAIRTEDEAALLDSLILCKFLRGVLEDKPREMAHMLELVTGWNTTGEELLTAAGRIITAKKLFNVRVGWTPEEDRLPRRFLTQALAGGASAGALLTEDRLAELILHYNRGRGWRDNGTPTPDQAAEIDALVVPYAVRPSLL